MKTLKATSINDLPEIARIVLEETDGQKLYCFFGKMGAGKTTFIKTFCALLGSQDIVTSPTFSLVNEYQGNNGLTIYHFDFYRIENIEEVYDFGFEEYIDSGNYCLMEWPERILELLQESYVYISIEVNEKYERIISFTGHPETP